MTKEPSGSDGGNRGKQLPCEACGELSPPGEYDVAIHDCDEEIWDLYTFTEKGIRVLALELDAEEES